MSIEANDSAAQRAATMRGDAPEAGEETRVSDWLGALRGMIRRRYPVMILVALATAAIAITIVLLMTPKYESVARLRIDPMRNPMATAQEANVGLTSEAIDTEVSALGSPELAREVVKRLNLQNDPEFAVGVNRQIAAGELAPEERLGAVAESVAKHLSVRRDKLTYVLAVSFTSREAVKSARIANAFAEAFVQTRVGSRASTAQDQVTFLTQQIEKLGAESQAADARVGQYRAQAGIVEGGASGTITDQQIAPLSTQLAEAASAAAEAQAKVTQARRQIASGNLDAVGDVRASPVIADLRRQRAEVTRNMGEIASRYGDRHPETIKVRQQLQGLDAQIKDEAERAVSSLDAEAAAANARVGSLRGGVNVLKSQQAVNTRAAVVADGLERDAATKRAALDRLNQLRIEALQSTRNIIGNIDIVDRAQIPLAPAAPRKSLLAGLALAASLALGFGVITVQELMAGGMRTVADIESQLRLPLLASIPLVRRRKNAGSPADSLIDQPASLFAEALRNARASILGVRGETPVQIVALTSALPEEGKTTTALALARVLGINGTKTLLIDCDLRKASLQSLMADDVDVGLVEVLNGSKTAEQAIVQDRVEAVDLLPVARKLFTGEDMFGSDRMKALLDSLRPHYQTIILDLPPVMGVADARSLSVLADAAVLIVRWGSTPPRAADTAVTWLRGDGANLLGAVYTLVDPNSEAVGGLFYSSKYASYYQQA